jgi:pimeloyl-ACP methyl ester carboxylesterase
MLKIPPLCMMALLVFPLPASAQREAAAASERVVNLPLGGGLSQRVLYVAPSRPRATLVMLPGGTGEVGVRRDGDLRHDDNFVVRTRAAWVARGYAVLIPDTIDQANLRGARSSTAYGRVVDELVAYAHARAAAPVFLLGTSQGTIAAMNAAAHAPPGLIAGLVLTEAVSMPGQLSTETVFDGDPQGVRVPALIVANRDDACNVAPPSMARRIAAAMARSPEARVLMVDGGVQRSHKACGSLSPHGYYGIEEKVVGAIGAWLQAHRG